MSRHDLSFVVRVAVAIFLVNGIAARDSRAQTPYASGKLISPATNDLVTFGQQPQVDVQTNFDVYYIQFKFGFIPDATGVMDVTTQTPPIRDPYCWRASVHGNNADQVFTIPPIVQSKKDTSPGSYWIYIYCYNGAGKLVNLPNNKDPFTDRVQVTASP